MNSDHYPLALSYHRNTARYPFNLHGLESPAADTAPFSENLDAPLISLPGGDLTALSLQDALRARLSCRTFSREPLPLEQVALLLKAGYGINEELLLGEQEFFARSVPSGGGLYPLELYLIARRVEPLEPGIYHYVPLYHGLEHLDTIELPDRFVSDLFLGQPYLENAAAFMVISALFERSLWKYTDRGYRYILFEAGHVAQSINLASIALGLGSLNLGGFYDELLANLLGIDWAEEAPLYAIALGKPLYNEALKARFAGVPNLMA